MHLTAPSNWSRSIGTGGRDPSERVVTIAGMRKRSPDLRSSVRHPSSRHTQEDYLANGASRSSSCRSADDYRAETLHRLEEEQREVKEFLESVWVMPSASSGVYFVKKDSQKGLSARLTFPPR